MNMGGAGTGLGFCSMMTFVINEVEPSDSVT
jgi:hypothetical protein